MNTTVTGSPDLNASAYYQADNQTLTVVLVNSSATPASVQLAVPPVPAGLLVFQTFTSSEGNYWQGSTVAVSGTQASVSVPGYGIVTLYGAGGALAPSISSQPRSQTVNACATVRFNVTANNPTASASEPGSPDSSRFYRVVLRP
ncbi:MAG: hypothetical protein KGS61_06165 [Verrucomicrobia bacterium]|nr:hypothetical protein [Verrucomicrobiota bacterium]